MAISIRRYSTKPFNTSPTSSRRTSPTLDRIISANLVDWTIDRLNYVDLAIIRYAVYEMKYAQHAGGNRDRRSD
ncbi:MAG: hypothetical protein MZU97_04095 [Bacillus subtilis]|nr:hypothetical protein [Bacillus subtilis]